MTELKIEAHPFPPVATEQRFSDPVQAPFPRPRVTSEDPVPRYAEVPNPVQELVAYATRYGWFVQLTYSEGYEPHATTGRPSAKLKVKWALRMHRGQERSIAVRTDATWTSLWYWSPVTGGMRQSAGLGVFREAIA